MISLHHLIERIATPVILANTADAGWAMADEVHRELAEHIETACLVFFVVELLMRLAYQRRRFWHSRWNIFDTAVMVLAVIPLPVNASVLRVGRAARLLHLGRHIAGLRVLRLLHLVHLAVR